MRYPNQNQSFPRKLWEILENEDPEIVGWSDSGNAFFIRSMELFIDEILTKYFRHNKFSSFQRQLNLYGFKKVNKGSDAGAYSMKLFQRTNPDALTKIKRSPQPCSSSSNRRRSTGTSRTRHSSHGSSDDDDDSGSDEEYRPRNARGFSDCFSSRGRRIRAARSLADEQAEEARRLEKAQLERERAQERVAREQQEQQQVQHQFDSHSSNVRAAAMARLQAPSARVARTPTETMSAYRQYDTQFLAKAGVPAPSAIPHGCSLSSEYLDKKLAELGAEHPYQAHGNTAMPPPQQNYQATTPHLMPQQAQSQVVPTRPLRSASSQSIEPAALDEFVGDFANRNSIGPTEDLPVAIATSTPPPASTKYESLPVAQTAIPLPRAASFQLPTSFSRSNSMEQAAFIQDLGGDLDAFWDDGISKGGASEADAAVVSPAVVASSTVAPRPVMPQVQAPTQFVGFNPMTFGAMPTSVTMPSRG